MKAKEILFKIPEREKKIPVKYLGWKETTEEEKKDKKKDNAQKREEL